MSLNYSSAGSAWNHSTIANQLSCIAFCEIIDDPSVKCQVKGEPIALTLTRQLTALLPHNYISDTVEPLFYDHPQNSIGVVIHEGLDYFITLGVRSLANARVELDSFKCGKY